MLTKGEIEEIREHLNKAQNPLFFFDNDADGLCSFLLLRRFIQRGKGVAIRSFPDLNVSYFRKVQELKPDYIFVLDKPIIADSFVEEAKKLNIPLVWIDHHDIGEVSKDIYYYNPTRARGNNVPTTFLCYQVSQKKEDKWIALCGCIADGFLPDFSEDIRMEYPELWRSVQTAFQGVYTTELGKLTRIFSFALKDRTSHVVTMIKYLSSIKSPYDILDEKKAHQMLFRFNQVDSKYQKLIQKAESFVKKGNLLYFQYGGELSLSADVSNELIYRHPDKVVVVVYIKGVKANISLRGSMDVRTLTDEAIKGIEGATGGGHLHATGAQMQVEDLPKFKENLERLAK
ncbi:MAG: DHH family phosphoesterase [archaeon]